MKKHKLSLKGQNFDGTKISANLLKELLEVVTDGAKGALRLKTEGRSTARGTEPAWLTKAADFDVLTISAGSTVLEIQDQSLVEALPEQFSQQQLFRTFDPSLSAFELFEISIADAIEGKADSDLYDDGLLAIYSRLGNLFNWNVDSVVFSNGNSIPTIQIQKNHVEQIGKLRQSTPPPQATRVAGKIETIRHSDKMFELLLDSGEKIRGIASGDVQLANYWGKRVMVVGQTVFRPSGAILRLEASKIEDATENSVTLWSKLPKAVPHRLHVSTLHRAQDQNSGLNKVWGCLSSDETDEEIQAALK